MPQTGLLTLHHSAAISLGGHQSCPPNPTQPTKLTPSCAMLGSLTVSCPEHPLHMSQGAVSRAFVLSTPSPNAAYVRYMHQLMYGWAALHACCCDQAEKQPVSLDGRHTAVVCVRTTCPLSCSPTTVCVQHATPFHACSWACQQCCSLCASTPPGLVVLRATLEE
jgi:hypothetical protein